MPDTPLSSSTKKLQWKSETTHNGQKANKIRHQKARHVESLNNRGDVKHQKGHVKNIKSSGQVDHRINAHDRDKEIMTTEN